MKNHLKATILLLVLTVAGPLLSATSVQAGLVFQQPVVEEEEKEEAGLRGEGRFGNEPEETGNWYGYPKGLDCDEVCELLALDGSKVCNAPTAHPLVNTAEKSRYVVEEEIGLPLGPEYNYVAQKSALNPGAFVDQPGEDSAYLTYNPSKFTKTTCTDKDPDFARLCCCGSTTGLVRPVGPS